MKPVLILAVYAALLLAGGLYAYVSAPPTANKATALIVPGVCAAIIAIAAGALAAVARKNPLRALKAGRWMAILPALFGLAFAGRAFPASKVAEKAYLANTLWGLTVVSAIVCIALVLAGRPGRAAQPGR